MRRDPICNSSNLWTRPTAPAAVTTFVAVSATPLPSSVAITLTNIATQATNLECARLKNIDNQCVLHTVEALVVAAVATVACATSRAALPP